MPKPQLLKIAALATLIAAALLHAGSAWVSTPCADYAIAVGAGPSYDVDWIGGKIFDLKEYSNYRCQGSQISDGWAWFYANNYASRMVNWACYRGKHGNNTRCTQQNKPVVYDKKWIFRPLRGEIRRLGQLPILRILPRR